MKTTFYDVKTRQKVEADITGKIEYQVNNRTRYAVKGKTLDGRNLTKFVSQSDYENTDI